MYGYIYKITNKLNGKLYIGKHRYPFPHLDEKYITSGVVINRCIKKHGIENFLIEMVDIAYSLEELNKLEIFYIKQFNSMNPSGYNLTKGGDGISDMPDEIRKKISETKLSQHRTSTPESNAKRSASLKKVIHTKEWIEKIRKANRGQVPTELSKQRSSEVHKGSKWYNNGKEEKMIIGEPPIGFVRGRLKSSKVHSNPMNYS